MQHPDGQKRMEAGRQLFATTAHCNEVLPGLEPGSPESSELSVQSTKIWLYLKERSYPDSNRGPRKYSVITSESDVLGQLHYRTSLMKEKNIYFNINVYN